MTCQYLTTFIRQTVIIELISIGGQIRPTWPAEGLLALILLLQHYKPEYANIYHISIF